MVNVPYRPASNAMDHEVAERIKEMNEQFREHYASKADLLQLRGDAAIEFGKLHTEIARMETRLIKWFVGTAITLTGMTFAIARYVGA